MQEAETKRKLTFIDIDGRVYQVHREMPITAFWHLERLHAQFAELRTLWHLGECDAFSLGMLAAIHAIIKLLAPGLPMRRIRALAPAHALAFITWWANEQEATDEHEPAQLVLSA